MRPTALRAALVPALLLALVGGCATRPPTAEETAGQATAEAEAKAQRMLDADRPLAAARVYRDLADQAAPDDAQRWRLRIVELLFREGYPELALDWYRELDARPVPDGLQTRKAVIDARAAIERRQGIRALRLVPPTTPDMDDDLRARILAIRADAYGMTGQPGRALAIRIRRESLLGTDRAVDDNNEAIWSLLQGLPADRLHQLSDRDQDPVLRGWAELALAVRRARMGEESIRTVLGDWRDRFPDHTAATRFVDTLRDRVSAEMSYPDRIALLLPLSGDLAGPGKAIRDGLMAAYYDQPEYVSRPRIRIYDTGGNQSVPALYDEAVDDGAGFVIGPLSKSGVAELADREALDVPVLSLNYLPDDAGRIPSKLYQFGLLPEDEARQAAEAAIQNEHYNAVALVPAGHWGGRMLDAFESRFADLGGVTLETARYNGEATDYSRPIQALMNLDRSYARERGIRSTVAKNIHFEPRRRQDVAMIFVVAQPRQGRLLEPQLEFHRAGDLPAYATSHVFTGVPDPDSDWDMNGLYFTDLPWVLDNLEDPGNLYRAVNEHWPGERARFPRLHALGIDAFSVLPHLSRLDERTDAALNGRTGRLTLDDRGRIHRHIRWATFIKGRPVPLPRPEAGVDRDGELGEDVRSRAGES